jgi:hypothetical protein
MKSPAVPAYPFGVEVLSTREGLLLKPRRQPRERWSAAFRDSQNAGLDELAETRRSRNEFDEKAWQW